MRVEVRRRPSPAGAAPSPKRSANPGLVKAYSDSCFESSTDFYIASPEHPKLGKWAKPSTLKYSQLPQQRDSTTSQCLNEALLFASSHSSGRPRTAGCSSRPAGRGGYHRFSREGGTCSSAVAASSPSGAKPSRPAVKPVRTQKPNSPTMGTSSSIKGQHEAPRMDTPISGRVRGVHFLVGNAASVALFYPGTIATAIFDAMQVHRNLPGMHVEVRLFFRLLMQGKRFTLHYFMSHLVLVGERWIVRQQWITTPPAGLYVATRTILSCRV